MRLKRCAKAVETLLSKKLLLRLTGEICVDMNDKWTQKRFMDVQDRDKWQVIDDSLHTSFS